jgi:16S rRNA (adenine1518-N6/adenine1519-N6)-dimethyltransferase
MVERLDLTDPRVLIPLLERHGFHTRKSLGQHFLLSRKVVDAIVDACALDGGPVLEIGPGAGTLTRALVEQGAHVTAVELDPRAVALVEEVTAGFPVRVVHGDILKVDLAALLADGGWTVVGNLPYYITTPVMTRVLELAERVRRAVFMVQREVADRLQAAPGGKTYGSLSVFVQTFAEVERIVKVPRGAFLPPPTVDSTVVRLTMRPAPLVPPALQPIFFPVVRAAFGQRRKTLENALANGGVLEGDRAAVAAALQAAGIAPSRRGETLSIAEFTRLAEEVAAR